MKNTYLPSDIRRIIAVLGIATLVPILCQILYMLG